MLNLRVYAESDSNTPMGFRCLSGGNVRFREHTRDNGDTGYIFINWFVGLIDSFYRISMLGILFYFIWRREGSFPNTFHLERD